MRDHLMRQVVSTVGQSSLISTGFRGRLPPQRTLRPTTGPARPAVLRAPAQVWHGTAALAQVSSPRPCSSRCVPLGHGMHHQEAGIQAGWHLLANTS
jgi:hypothetical protein